MIVNDFVFHINNNIKNSQLKMNDK